MPLVGGEVISGLIILPVRVIVLRIFSISPPAVLLKDLEISTKGTGPEMV